MYRWWLGVVIAIGWGGEAADAVAGQARVAVASNFIGPARALAGEFKRVSGDEVVISAGSTGALYTQIVNGAPFDAFFAANADEPQRLEREGLGVAGTRFTYATGVLALWTTNSRGLAGDGAQWLRNPRGAALAIANPKTAPYGAAALESLKALGVDTAQWRIVQGENIAQTYQFVATGNAQFGFVALAQLREARIDSGFWVVPASLHAPLQQQAILLKRGAENSVARRWLAFVRAPDTRKVLRDTYGYQTEP